MTGSACLFSVRKKPRAAQSAARSRRRRRFVRRSYKASRRRVALTLFSLEGEGKWFRNIDYYRLDGSTNAITRKKWAEEFNDTSNVR